VIEARLSEETFVRLDDFDLSAFWKQWCASRANSAPCYSVAARIAPALVPVLPYYFGDRTHGILAQAGSPDADGWITLCLPFESFEVARERILGMGRAVQVIEPEALRLSIIDFAEQIIAFCGSQQAL
jgi:hypothetical protein